MGNWILLQSEIVTEKRVKGFFMFKKNKNFIDFIKSLKFRLILLIFILVLVPEVVLCVGILNTYESRAISIRESEVLSQAKILANQIAVNEYVSSPQKDDKTLEAQIDMLTNVYDGRVIVVNNNFEIVKDTYNLDDNKTIISEEVVKSFSGEEITNFDSKNHYIELAIPINNPDDDDDEKVIGVLVVSVSTDNISLNLSYLTQIAVIAAILSGAVMLFFGVLFSIYLVSPFEQLSNKIKDIKEGYGDKELSVDSFTETKVICENFNSLVANMKVMDESRQEFVSNVSHELKTPLTSMKVLADSINSMGDEAPIELYREFMGDITNEIERETKIINDLLSLVKMDKSAADLNIDTVNINELLEQILKRLQPIADKQKVEIVFESFRPVTAEIDEVKLSLAFTNLVENAIKYNGNEEGGWVHVSLNADHQFFFLKVEDNGIGIPEDSLEHIYDRFYRVDKSHSREIGGTGLGLAITRSSILMHRGAIKVHSVLGEGTTFDVRIPLSYIV